MSNDRTSHADHLVDLVDEYGAVTGSKPRREIDKLADRFHTVFVVLRTPETSFILGKIPSRKDLPNIYTDSIGATAATIRRHNERPQEAAIRAVRNELRIESPRLRHIDDDTIQLSDRTEHYVSLFCCTHSMPEDFSHTDIENLVTFTPAGLNEAVRSNQARFAPTFLALWQIYQEQLLTS